MAEVVAKCGYRCDLCAAYEANFRGEADSERIRAAFKKYYGFDVPPDAIKACVGCQAATEAIDPECGVWPCAVERGVETCGECEAFGCEVCRSRMDAVADRVASMGEIPPDDYEAFVKPYLGRETLEKRRSQ